MGIGVEIDKILHQSIPKNTAYSVTCVSFYWSHEVDTTHKKRTMKPFPGVHDGKKKGERRQFLDFSQIFSTKNYKEKSSEDLAIKNEVDLTVGG